MDKPRRRAAGRPAGPPNPVAPPTPPGAETPLDARSDASPSSAIPMEAAAPPSPHDGLPEQTGPSGQQSRRRQRPARQPSGPAAPPAGGANGGAAPLDPDPTWAQRQRQSAAPSSPPSSGPATGRDDRRRGESSVERSLRALVSTRTTQLPPTVAMRAREVAAPTSADLATAEQELVIVRRYYVPPAPLATTGKTADQRTPVRRPAEGKRGGRRTQQG